MAVAADDDAPYREAEHGEFDRRGGAVMSIGQPHGGTSAPTLRTMKSSPGPAPVSRYGTRRESEQPMKSVRRMLAARRTSARNCSR